MTMLDEIKAGNFKLKKTVTRENKPAPNQTQSKVRNFLRIFLGRLFERTGDAEV